MNANGDLTRDDLSRILSQQNLTTDLFKAKKQILNLMVNQLTYLANQNREQPELELSPKDKLIHDTKLMLNAVGPAAASAAVDNALLVLQKEGKYQNIDRNRSFITNTLQVMNEAGDGAPSFSNVLRQFLLPRYAYLDFDMMVDPRHKVDLECGYPKFITPIMYRYMYDRDDVASRVNDFYADETWAVEPDIYDEEDENTTTVFEQSVKTLIDDRNLLQMIYRMDKLCGIGHYGALLIGIDDGKELDQPVDGLDAYGRLTDDPYFSGGRSVPVARELLYMRPFDEYLSFVQLYETNPSSPRYGLPVIYNLVFLDMTIDAAGASIGTRLNRRVHWTRICHIIAPNQQSSLVFGIPRMQRVFNRLLDLRKIKGGSAEGMWKGGFPGLAFEVDPNLVADEPDFDRKEFDKQVEEYMNGMQRSITLLGMKAQTLAPNVADPSPHVKIQLEAIAAHMNAPLSIFLGIGEGRVNKGEEAVQWQKRLGRHIRMFTNPSLVRIIIQRLIALRVLPRPKNDRFFVDWPDLTTPTNEDKANLSLKWTQALSQYVASGVIHLIAPQDYLTTILGLKPAEAIRILKAVKALGGFAKLLKVDPSQGAGVNGKRQAPAGSDGREGEKGANDPHEKQTDGMEA